MTIKKHTALVATARQAVDTWDDIYEHILKAKHFIYISGWSVNATIKLLRREWSKPEKILGPVTLGDLLKMKAEEGVLVCVMLWNDKTSLAIDAVGIKTAGWCFFLIPYMTCDVYA